MYNQYLCIQNKVIHKFSTQPPYNLKLSFSNKKKKKKKLTLMYHNYHTDTYILLSYMKKVSKVLYNKMILWKKKQIPNPPQGNLNVLGESLFFFFFFFWGGGRAGGWAGGFLFFFAKKSSV